MPKSSREAWCWESRAGSRDRRQGRTVGVTVRSWHLATNDLVGGDVVGGELLALHHDAALGDDPGHRDVEEPSCSGCGMQPALVTVRFAAQFFDLDAVGRPEPNASR